ncbi:MAG TPA: sterol desaturase family protein [Chitinophagaceae bacterium]|jgi:sterol desaturase/sphingolipid hydroxylase (fatty acid hydroxylase superfamily)|nr:sterol desaturase family protein [Chitinophagaceae bacterium]
METYGKILLIAMPAFLFLVLFEKWYGWRKGHDTVRNMDMIASLSSGITNVTKDVLGLSIVIISYGWMADHFAVTHVKGTLLTYIVAFLALDFAGYWTHRIQHKVNLFWNGHIIHHSSEEYNLACALRQSISSMVKIFVVFLLPAALLGVPEKVIAIVAPLHLFAQFWYHTQHIGKMGFLEKVIVTPSHHRVHHAMNPEYIDKNFGQIFIFWDKWFGTYQPELPAVQPVYGITRPAATWNPIKINFQHIWLLMKDAWRTRHWRDKLRIWFMPTGWRPADIADKYPVYKITDVYHFTKYHPQPNKALQYWAWCRITVLLLLISYLFGNIAAINTMNNSYIYLYGLFIFLDVYAYTELMDRNRYALVPELVKTVFGLSLIYQQGDWFGAESQLAYISYILAAYFVVSSIVTVVFVSGFKKEKKEVALAA